VAADPVPNTRPGPGWFVPSPWAELPIRLTSAIFHPPRAG
jgi:hypothetical protein